MLLYCAVGCNDMHTPDYTTGLEQFDLSPEKLESLTIKAQAGDRSSARKLMLYYGYVKNDMSSFKRWKKIVDSQTH